MKLIGAEEIILERAHRSGQMRHGRNGDASPRPIHVKFLNWMDKEYVLKRAPKSLNNPSGRQQATLIITDDVTKIVCEQRKILKTQYLPKILEKPDVKVGFIPHVYGSARIQYKGGDRWNFFLSSG